MKKAKAGEHLSSLVASKLDWGLWLLLLIAVTVLGLAIRNSSASSARHLRNDPYDVGVERSHETHSRVETGL